eukprot:TRINITY_DN2343_c0_g1_i1.p1 TRINITY_DN2343_c0_g1~~TRINITY_DN2343_c0_g1_i1.p1  ORF type:complete len:716 (+),score=129.67 TRINITY_DN2343_c0_g1_i1:81-2228(+)
MAIWAFFCDLGDKRCLSFNLQVKIHYTDGTDSEVVSDAAWRGTQGPIVFNHLYHGEIYDARLEQPGWSSPNFKNESNWSLVSVMSPDVGALSSRMMPGIRIVSKLKPRSILRLDDGSWVIDIGKNIAGFCSLTVPSKTPAGTNITLYHGELLFPNNTVQNQFYGVCMDDGGNCANQTVTYLARGSGEEEYYRPTFTYFGFRYVQLYGFPGEPTFETLEGLMLHNDVEEAGKINFTEPLFNSLQEAITLTQRDNLMSIPTDCPHREKRGWMADGQWSSEEAMYNFDMAAFYSNWIRSMIDTQLLGCTIPLDEEYSARPVTYICCNGSSFGCEDDYIWTDTSGSLPDVVPYPKQPYGGWPGDPTWESALMVVPYYMYKQYGDERLIRDYYNNFKYYVDFLSRHTGEDGLLTFGELGDWLNLNKTPTPLVSSFYYILDIEYLAFFATIVGNSNDAMFYEELAKKMKIVYHEAYFNKSIGCYGPGSQTAQILPLYLDIVPSEHLFMVVSCLTTDLKQNSITTGGVGTRYLLQTLSKYHLEEYSLELVNTTKQPSWGYFIEQGPGTIWESWEGTFYNSKGFSKNHPMFASGLGVWFYTDVVGIEVNTHDIIIKPKEYYMKALGKLSARVNTIQGDIFVEWDYNPSLRTMTLSFGIPVGYTARFYPSSIMSGNVTLREGDEILCQNNKILRDNLSPMKDLSTAEEIIIGLSGGSYNFVLDL